MASLWCHLNKKEKKHYCWMSMCKMSLGRSVTICFSVMAQQTPFAVFLFPTPPTVRLPDAWVWRIPPGCCHVTTPRGTLGSSCRAGGRRKDEHPQWVWRGGLPCGECGAYPSWSKRPGPEMVNTKCWFERDIFFKVYVYYLLSVTVYPGMLYLPPLPPPFFPQYPALTLQ